MNEYLQAVILGLIQALTEFLPVSSSGHLLLAPLVLGQGVSSLTFDVGLHVGTLAATLVYFWRDWVFIVRSALGDLVRHQWHLGRWGQGGRLGLWIVLGTLPAVVVGAVLNHTIETSVRQPAVVGALLLIFGLMLAWADRLPQRVHGLDRITLFHALTIGVAQAVALVPGVSRSGITITTGRALHLDRDTAARFTFLLAMPAVLAAATLKLAEAATGSEAVRWGPMAIGALVSGLAGIVVIHWLLGYLRAHSLMPFVWYRVALGLVVIVLAVSGRI